MKERLILLALTITISMSALSSCSEGSPIIPEVPKPNTPGKEDPKVPTPEPEEKNPIPSFHNIKLNGNGVVLEISSYGNLESATYPFKIEGTNMFLDLNANGTKDSGEEIGDKFSGDLSAKREKGKSVFIIMGNITSFELLTKYQNKTVGEDDKYPRIYDSKLDASKCTTLKNIKITDSSLSVLDVFMNKSLEKLDISGNNIQTLFLKHTTKLEELNLHNNVHLQETLDLSTQSSLKTLNINKTRLKSTILPETNKIEYLELKNTEIEKIDLSKAIALKKIKYSGNKLTSIDISNCKEIKEIDLYEALSLTEIVDSKTNEGKNKLETIIIGETPKLTKFDFSSYKALRRIYAHNELGVDMSNLPNLLPEIKEGLGTLVVSQKNFNKIKDISLFIKKNWYI